MVLSDTSQCSASARRDRTPGSGRSKAARTAASSPASARADIPGALTRLPRLAACNAASASRLATVSALPPSLCRRRISDGVISFLVSAGGDPADPLPVHPGREESAHMVPREAGFARPAGALDGDQRALPAVVFLLDPTTDQTRPVPSMRTNDRSARPTGAQSTRPAPDAISTARSNDTSVTSIFGRSPRSLLTITAYLFIFFSS